MLMVMRILLLALPLAACGGGASTAENAAAPAELSAFENAVVALSPAERNAMLIAAVRDAGKDCQGVTESYRDTKNAGAPLFIAKCSNGASYGVQVGPDGTARVIGAR
jgi:hypothetical protein